MNGFIGFGLYFAPVGMIAEMERTEMVDRLLKAIALSNDENPHGFDGERSIATERSGNIHRFCFELSMRVVKKAQKSSGPTVKREWGLVVGYDSRSQYPLAVSARVV
jgi:hypothetical protein